MATDISSIANQAGQGGGLGQMTAREVEVLLSANTGPFQEEMKKAGTAAGGVAEALHKVEKAYVSALRVMGGTMMGIGAGMQATATGATWAAVQFEESFARVAKTTGLENSLAGMKGPVADMAATFGIGSNALQTFENDIRSLSTEIPVSVTELSGLADIAGTLGVSSENLVLFADTAAKLGAGINELSSGQAISGLANLVGAFGESEERVVNLGSGLAELSNNTRGSADQMLYFSDRMAGTAVQVGITSEEVLGLGAAVSAIGMNPQLGASALNDFFVRVSRSVQNGTSDLDKFAAVMGKTREEVQELFETSPTDFFIQFIQRLGAQGDQAIVTLERLGLQGQGLTQVLGGLAAQSGLVAESMGIARDATEEGSAVAELAAIRWNTVVSALRQFRQSISEVTRSMGQAFLVPLNAIISGMTSLVNVFNSLPQPIKTLLGLFLGLGGAVLTAMGAFTMFFASFHAFFALLHAAPILVAKLSAVIGNMGGDAAMATRHLDALAKILQRVATNLQGLASAPLQTLGRLLSAGAEKAHGALSTLSLFLRAKLGEALKFGADSVKTLAHILRQNLPRAASAASTAMQPFIKALAWIRKTAVAETLAAMSTALGHFGRAALAAAGKMAPLMLLLGKFLLIAAVIGGLVWAFRKLTGGTDEAAGGFKRLAGAADMAYESVDSLASVLDGMESKNIEVNVELAAHDEIEMLRRLTDGEAEDYLIAFGMKQILSGEAPSEVVRLIERLAELSDTPIEIDVLLNTINEGEGFRQLLDIGGSAIDRFIDSQDGKVKSGIWNSIRGNVGAQTEEDFSDQLALALQAIPQGSPSEQAARLAVLGQVQQDLNQARSEGDISASFYEWAQNQIQETGLAESGVMEERNWLERNILNPGARALGVVGRVLPFSPSADMQVNSQRYRGQNVSADFRDYMGSYVEDETILNTDEGQEIRALVQDITGETDNLADAIDNLDDEGIQRLIDGFIELSGVQQDAYMESIRDPQQYDTNLEAVLASRPELSEADQDRFRKFIFENYPQMEGVSYEQALSEAQQMLDALAEDGREFGEEAEEIRTTLAKWGDEFAQVRIKDLEQELNAMGAVEQVQHLNRELQNIEATQANQPVIEAMMERRQQAMDNAVNEFRQVMSQYDSLREQEANAIENHQRRLSDMEEEHNRRTQRREEDHQRRMTRMREDRNKRLAEAEESYQDRLEDIAKREKELHEQRVETVQNAFGIMERIQSAPSASGSAVAHNMRLQTRVMAEMQEGIKQLRQMGLNEDIMEAMGFDDPRNFAQVSRMLAEATSNPAMIEEINRNWARHAKVSEAFTKEIEASDIGDTITKQMAEMREDAEKAFNEQLETIRERHREQVEDANENYQRQVDDANDAYTRQVDRAEENHTRQMESIADNIAKLGQKNIESVEDLIKRGVETGIEGIEKMGSGLEGIMASMNDTIVGSTADTMAAMHDEIEAGLDGLNDLLPVVVSRPGESVDMSPMRVSRPGESQGRRRRQPARNDVRDSGFNTGGPVPGVGNSDTVPALLTPGEFVINADAVAHYGMDWLKDVNAQKYATGGAVGMPRSRGREFAGGGMDMVKAFEKALEKTSVGARNETNFGPITVQAHDVNDLLKQLEHKKRVSRLAGGASDG